MRIDLNRFVHNNTNSSYANGIILYMQEYLNPIFDLLNYRLFSLGQAQITPLSIVYFFVLASVLIFVTGRLKNLLVGKLLERTPLQRGARQAIWTITRYLLLFIGFVVILQTVGIDLTAFNVFAGAVGIGIGLGLQNVANNFISGLIILFERPIQIGDRIDVGTISGEVVSIGPRSTHVRTNDNITIIVPNSKFVSENVTNWSYENQTVRFRIPALVTHDSDIHLVSKLLVEAADENPDIVAEPRPTARFIKFDGDGLLFELRAWSRARLHRPGIFRSDVNFAIVEKFRANGIRLADSGRLEVRTRNADATNGGPPPRTAQQRENASPAVG
jgi:small-conductance mechanosensitive channel